MWAVTSRWHPKRSTRSSGSHEKAEECNFLGFTRAFQKASQRAGKPKQYLVPYFIASHPARMSTR